MCSRARAQPTARSQSDATAAALHAIQYPRGGSPPLPLLDETGSARPGASRLPRLGARRWSRARGLRRRKPNHERHPHRMLGVGDDAHDSRRPVRLVRWPVAVAEAYAAHHMHLLESLVSGERELVSPAARHSPLDDEQKGTPTPARLLLCASRSSPSLVGESAGSRREGEAKPSPARRRVPLWTDPAAAGQCRYGRDAAAVVRCF